MNAPVKILPLPLPDVEEKSAYKLAKDLCDNREDIRVEEKFDWEKDPDVIIKHQNAIAVYENVRGCLMIRRQKDWDEDDDTFISIAPDNLDALKTALSRFSKKEGRLG